jgi:uncharacterized protein (DUF362 family)
MKIDHCYAYDCDQILKTPVWEDFPNVKEKSVFVKPNLVIPPTRNDLLSCTQKSVVEAVLRALRMKGAGRVIVGDCGFKGQWEKTQQASGYSEICREYDAEFICVQDGENYHKYSLKRFEKKEDYLSLYGIKISNYVLDADVVINIPKLKVHSLAGITCSIKNMMGVIQPKGSMHPGASPDILHKRLRDLYKLLSLIVSWILVDGVAGSEYSETYGVPKKANVLISGTDMWEVDCAAAQVMGIAPERISYLKYISVFKGDYPKISNEFVTLFEFPLIMREAL